LFYHAEIRAQETVSLIFEIDDSRSIYSAYVWVIEIKQGYPFISKLQKAKIIFSYEKEKSTFFSQNN